MATGLADRTATPMETALVAEAQRRGASPALAAALAAAGLPHRRQEAWRWTDVRAALREAPPFAPGAQFIADAGAFAAAEPLIVTLEGGRPEWSGARPAGLSLDWLPGIRADGPLGLHSLAMAATALAHRALVVEAAPGAAIDRPVLLRQAADGVQTHSRVVVRVGAGARLELIESFEATRGGLINAALEVEVGEGGALTRRVLQEADGDAAVFSTASVRLHARSTFEQAVALFGGRIVRVETMLRIDGSGAKADLASAALLSEARHADATSSVAFNAPGAQVRQIHRSAMAGRARGVFQGKFLVNRAGQQTDADMQAQALLLSPDAEASHKPELEIYADDVACAHGSTAGALDAAAIFYLRQRGLDAAAARALLIEAFFGAPFAAVEDTAFGIVVRERLLQRLGGLL